MVLLDFSLVPLGQGESISAYVARALQVVQASGLPYQLHAMGTIMEGELAEVLAVVQRCIEELQSDCPRLTCTIKLDYRQGADRLHAKIRSVQAKLDSPAVTTTPSSPPQVGQGPSGEANG